MRHPAKTLPKNPFLSLIHEVKQEVEPRIRACLDREIERVGPNGAAVHAMLSECRALTLRGGKRLRAALVLTGQKATEKRRARWDRALTAGVAVELLQSYLLIHDDWMDQDDARRGGPTVHAALAKRFRSVHRGACSAILGGDYLVALATRVLLDASRGHPRQTELLTAFTDMQIAAVVGQELDSMGLSSEAELVYELKTASYTVGGPLRLGALLAGADRHTLGALDRFSKPLGVAFQMRDDLLSLFARPEDTGKPFANDLRAGKRTWTVEWTLAHGALVERRALKRVFGKRDANQRELHDAIGAIVAAGGDAATEARLRALTEEAASALDRGAFSPAGSALLRGAAQALTERGT